MRVLVYGIKNCETMKKTFRLLEDKGVDYEFIDYKKRAPDEGLMVRFSEKVGYETLINKKGTTFKKLSDEEKKQLENEEGALTLLIEKSSMIKRPIIEFPDRSLVVGFDTEKIREKTQ